MASKHNNSTPDKQVKSRKSDGTFAKGTSGNPRGRPRSEAVEVRRKLMEYADDVIQRVIESAQQGDMTACRLILDRIVPALKPSAAVTVLDIPDDTTMTDAAKAIMRSAAEGSLPPDIAAQLIAALGNVAKVAEIDEIERRLTELEEAHGTN